MTRSHVFMFCFARHGVRNSLLIAPMPTASTAQILGNNESIEPYTTNIYTRRVLSGEFQVGAKRYFRGSGGGWGGGAVTIRRH
jgi:hypothetical protein